MIQLARLAVVSVTACALPLVTTAAAAEPATDFSTVVRGATPPAGIAAPAQTTLPVDEARRVAGGFGDALRVVESLPAVARTPLGSGALVVWGAAPSESRLLFLGMELPALYHAGGQRGVLPATLFSQLKLIPAAFGSEYGRALGGLLVLSPRTLPAGTHIELAADLLDVGAALSLAIGPHLRLLVSGRYSYLDRLLTALSRPDLGDYLPLPQYYDAQAQAQVQLADGALLRTTFLASGDTLVRAHAIGDASRAHSETWTQQSYRFGTHYERPAAPSSARGSLVLSPWLGFDRRTYRADFGGTPMQRAEDELLYGLRASYRPPLLWQRQRTSLSLLLGLDLLGRYDELSRTGTLGRPPREESVALFGQRPGFFENSDAWTVHTLDVALYAALSLRLPWLRVEPGLRIGTTLLDVSRLLPRVGAAPPLGSRQLELQAAPRLALTVQPLASLRLSVAGGLYFQPPAAADLSAVFGRPTLGVQRALHVSLAGEWTPVAALHIEAAVYLRWLDHLVAPSPLSTPPLAQALSPDGSGRSYGGQIGLRLFEVALRRRSAHLSGWVGYSVSRSERRAAPQSPLLPTAFDQTHGLQAAVQMQLWALSSGLRLRYSTGLPREAVIGSYYNAWADQYEPLRGPLGSTRLPDFVQLDLRLEYMWIVARHLRLAVQLEVQNLSNQKNVQELAYSADWQQVEPITGLPTLAVLGLRVTR